MSMKRLTLFFLSLMIGLGWASAQNRTVTGTVTSSEDNLPIIGVNVVVVGQTNIGAATNIDGKFTLSVPETAKQLRFTAISMKELILDIRPEMNVVMNPDDAMLDAVVVVGYGTGQKLGTVTGSVARVSSEKLENKPVANVMDALQGQVAGMHVQTSSGDPNSVASVKIHGAASLGASNEPLYIVDGMQTSAGVVMAMNSSDFESFTVLTDASSTSIYGARAANGVIVITTKKGKRNQDGVINVSTLYGVAQIISDRPMRQIMSGQDQINYLLRHQDSKKNKENLIKGFVPTAFDGQLMGDTAIVNRDHDWLKVMLGKIAPTYQADMSIAGGSDNISYYFSGGYFSQEGISAATSKYDKLNLRANVDARVKEWLRVGVNVSGGVVNSKEGSGFSEPFVDGGSFGALVIPKYYSPFVRISDTEFGNTYADVVRVHRNVPSVTGRVYMPEYRNTFSDNRSNSVLLAASSYAQVNPIEGLTLKSQFGVDYTSENGANRYFPDNPEAAGLGQARRSWSMDYIATWTNTAEYKWKLDDINDFTFLLGHEFVNSHTEGFEASGRGMLSREFMFIQMGQLGDFLVQPEEFASDYAYLSFFGRVNYTFKNWLAADVTIRNDRSSRFGRNHQGATFFSVGAMYDIKNAWLPEHELISSLRFKANYGTQGNSAIPLYAADARTGTINYTNQLAFGVTTIGNPDLAWERQGMFSVGAEAGIWEDRLSLALTYYHRKTRDMLMDVPLPYSTGYSTRWENVGAITNQGFDLDFEYTYLKTEDWNAFFRTSLNYNFERVDELFNEETNANGYKHPADLIFRVGKPIVYFQAISAGINKEGKQTWYIPGKGDETTDKFSEALRQPVEYALTTPPFTGGFTLGATWKNQISLVADFSFSVGNYTMNNDRYFLENNVSGFMFMNRSKILLDEWTEGVHDQPNAAPAKAPKFGEALSTDTRLLENASYLRMKNITLSYTFPKSLFANLKVLSGAKVYVTGRNLLTVVHSSYNGFDPETSSMGYTLNKYPATRQYVGGIQLTF